MSYCLVIFVLQRTSMYPKIQEYMLVTEEVLAKMQDNFGPDVEVDYQGSVKTLGTL